MRKNDIKRDLRYLQLLSQRFPTIAEASTEIINLQAILNLPKGTEHFLADLHGEYKAFQHVLKNASGNIKRKVNDIFGNTLRENEKRELCTLIYYPEQKIQLVKAQEDNINDWYHITIHQLVSVCRDVSSKYTRSKVRKALPEDFAYIIEELLHESTDDHNKAAYVNVIISTIISTGRADDFIIALCNVIQRLAIDQLHILGDIFDRGEHADLIMDLLMNYENELDIQWGNHDILWMGAAAGNPASIFVCINNNVKYGNYEVLENGYGISMRNLVLFAEKTYTHEEGMDPLKKAISVLIFKLEGQLIKRHPEYKMDNRMLLGTPSGSAPRKRSWSKTCSTRSRIPCVFASTWTFCIPTVPCTSASMKICSITDVCRSTMTETSPVSISGAIPCREERIWTKWTRKSEARGARRTGTAWTSCGTCGAAMIRRCSAG